MQKLHVTRDVDTYSLVISYCKWLVHAYTNLAQPMKKESKTSKILRGFQSPLKQSGAGILLQNS